MQLAKQKVHDKRYHAMRYNEWRVRAKQQLVVAKAATECTIFVTARISSIRHAAIASSVLSKQSKIQRQKM